MFVALGDTPLAALDHCTARGLVSPDRILGAFSHPFGSSGSEVDVYIGRRDPSTLHDKCGGRFEVIPRQALTAQRRCCGSSLRSSRDIAATCLVTHPLGGPVISAASPILFGAKLY